MVKFQSKGVINLNLLVTLDSNYIHPLMVMLKSIEITNPYERLTVYVIHTRLTQFDFSRLRYNFSGIKFVPIVPDDKMFENAHFTKRISKETYYRLLACECLPESVDRVLYLDPDIVVIGDLRNLYNYNFSDKCFVACGHTGGVVEEFNRIRLGMSRESTYINAGVLMMNLKKLREIININDIYSYINKKGKLLFQADQDVINALFYNRTAYMPPTVYNLDEHTYKKYKLSSDYVISDTVIIHYDGKNKPWKSDYKGSLNEYYDFFERQLNSNDTEIQISFAN